MDTISLLPTTKNMQAKTNAACHKYPRFSRSSASSQVKPNAAGSISQDCSKLGSAGTLGILGDSYIARMATIPKAVETIASINVVESRSSQSSSSRFKWGREGLTAR